MDLTVPNDLVGDFYIAFKINSDLKRFVNSQTGNDKLSYFITDRTNTNYYILDWPFISSNKNIIPFNLTGSNKPVLRVPIYIWVDPGQKVSPGDYQGNLDMVIYEGLYTGALNNSVYKTSIPISIRVSNQVIVSLGSNEFNQFTEFKVNFEELREGAIVNYDAFVNAVGEYTLVIKSKNKGTLGHRLPEIKTAIPYQLFLDDKLIQFDQNGEYTERITNVNNNASKHQLKMILGQSKHAFKGGYTDSISIKAIIQ